MISRGSPPDNLFKTPHLMMMTWPLTLHLFETVSKLYNTGARMIRIQPSKPF